MACKLRALSCAVRPALSSSGARCKSPRAHAGGRYKDPRPALPGSWPATGLSGDIIRLRLGLPGAERFRFLAGQYIDILMRGGKRRSFSLANAPHEDQRLELHIRYYEGGLFSEYAFHELREKALLHIEGPLGRFTLQRAESPHDHDRRGHRLRPDKESG